MAVVTTLAICPRCGGRIQSKGGAVFAAGSRTTPERDIDICGKCGSDEAERDMVWGPGHLPPVAEWPLADAHEYYNAAHGEAN